MANREEQLDIAAQAEQDLNSHRAKVGLQEGTGFGGKDTKGGSLSTDESGIDQSVEKKFAQYGATADYGSHVSGAGDNRDIPVSEGGDVQKGTGRLTKAGDFDQGEAGQGPEDLTRERAEQYGGEDDIRRNIRGPPK